MLSRNDQPNIVNFNFAVDSVFTNIQEYNAFVPPPSGDNFLLMDGTPFLLMDGTNFLLMGT